MKSLLARTLPIFIGDTDIACVGDIIKYGTFEYMMLSIKHPVIEIQQAGQKPLRLSMSGSFHDNNLGLNCIRKDFIVK